MWMLLKYDWKRNANVSFGLLAVLICLQLIVSIVGNTRNWSQEFLFVLTVFLYVTALIIFMILACKTYENNIKAYSRRLLPMRPVWTAVSTLIFWWISALVIGVFIVIHILLYDSIVGIPIDNLVMNWSDYKELISIFLIVAWSVTFIITLVLLSITIGATVSLRGNAGTWVAIGVFFLLQYMISFTEHLLFSRDNDLFLRVGTVQPMENGVSFDVFQFSLFTWAAWLYEVGLLILMLYTINYLLSKRVGI